MPRNFNKYQYETSPRKLEPEYTPNKNPYKAKKTTTRTKSKARQEKTKKQNEKIILYIVLGFSILFAISYRNSQIDESFMKVQELKEELSQVEKENAQLEVSIENGLNFNNNGIK